ncbi:MAG TPA: cation:proton antiporter, partial [Bacteroidia bacterium]|nr:cation:proton antiporter [Bacteroidia bacterium]
MRKSLLFIVVLLALFLGGLWKVISMGSLLPVKPKIEKVQPVLVSQNVSEPITGISQALTQFKENIRHPLSLLLLQILVIIATSRVFSFLLSKLGQQTVIGEIIAGIVLGPSVLKFFFPHFFQFLFPSDSLNTLLFLSQIGLAFFMFIIGMDLDIDVIISKAGDALTVSIASIIVPFLLGACLAYYLYPSFGPDGVGFLSFSLFIGISVSITAFPVLARILQERGMTKTPIGSMAIMSAATNDLMAWCMLAAVIAIAKAGNITSALFTIVLAVLFVVTMLYIVRPLLQKLTANQLKKHEPGKVVISVSFFILLASAYFTELIGVHALFGAFLAGVIMPHNLDFRKRITEKIEDVSVLVLLPIFFAFTGLRTQMGLLNQSSAWVAFGYILLVAVSGKFIGTAVAAKITGQNWGNSLTLGALMNTRGLMELIVLNIGYDLGILSPEIFAMMVLMALAT